MTNNIWGGKPPKGSYGLGTEFMHVELMMPKHVAEAITKIAFELDMNRSRYLCCLCIAAIDEYEEKKRYKNDDYNEDD